MGVATTVFGTRQSLPQAEPKEGRAKFPIGSGPGGGDGVTFVTGNEIFQWQSNQTPGPQEPSGIQGMWLDATALAANKHVQVAYEDQAPQFAAGTQGYFPIPSSKKPFVAQISSPDGGTGLVKITFYNYNPLFTGAISVAPASGSQTGSGAGGGSGYSGGGFTPPSEGGGRPTL
jgi:hypothetical protein